MSGNYYQTQQSNRHVQLIRLVISDGLAKLIRCTDIRTGSDGSVQEGFWKMVTDKVLQPFILATGSKEGGKESQAAV